MANSNCRAWNVCTEEEPDTDRARAEAGGDLESGADVTRGKTEIRVASEATSRTEADNGTWGREHQPPAAGGNLEMFRCDYWS